MSQIKKYFISICSYWFSLNKNGHEWVIEKNDGNSSDFEKVIKQIEIIIDDLKSSPEKWQNNKLDEKSILNRFAKSNFFDLEYKHFTDDYDFYIEICLMKKQIYIRVFEEKIIDKTKEKTIGNTTFVVSYKKIIEITEN